MPRNASGTYTLPAGNPVEAGTLIEASWANSTLEDIGNEITNSLSRDGEGGMLAPFRLADGTLGAPGIAWLNEPSTGFYRAGTGEMWGVVQGVQVLQYTANGVLIPTGRTLTAQGNASIGGTLAVTGATTLTGALAANGGVATTTLSTTGLATLDSASVTGNLSVGGTLVLTGGLTLNGNVTVGDSSTDTLTINSTLTSDLIFTDNTYDIGKSGVTRPRDLFLSRNATVGGTLSVTGAATLSSTLAVTGAITASSNGSFGGTLGVTGNTTLSGNLTFSGSAKRITGDFSTTSPISDRVVIQSSTMNGNTTVTVIPNGTAANSGFLSTNNSDPTNASTAQMRVNSSEMAVISGITGTGTYLPMVFLTNNTERMRIATNGDVTLTNNPILSGGTANGVLYLNGSKVATSDSALTFDGNGQVISVNSSTNALRITQTGSGNALLVEDSTNPDSTPFVIDASGNVGIGTTAPSYLVDVYHPTSAVLSLTGDATASVSVRRFSTNASSPALQTFKYRGTQASPTIVASGDAIGRITFNGYDGANTINSAQIQAEVDGTPGTNDMPGRLIFSTTADGASTLTERVRIDNTGQTKFSYNAVIETTDNTNAALRITQAGTGNALLVEDTTNPDSTPFVIDASGNVISGTTASVAFNYATTPRFEVVGTSQSSSAIATASFNGTAGAATSVLLGRGRGTVASPTVVVSGDDIGLIQFEAHDGTALIPAASILAEVDGTPGTNDMPGRLSFWTTADGASSPTERMRISSAGTVGIGITTATAVSLRLGTNLTGSTSAIGHHNIGVIQSDVTGSAAYFQTQSNTAAASFTVSNLRHFTSAQGTFGAGSTVTNQYGFVAQSSLTGATNNFGFYSDIASGTGRWNFYAAGTADNYFAGSVGIGTSSPTTKLDLYDATNPVYFQQTRGSVVQLSGPTGTAVTSPGQIGTSSNSPFRFITNNTEVARFDTSGNLGLGVTPSAWRSSTKAIDISTYGAISQNSGGGGGVALYGNSYEDGVDTYKYKNSYYATLYRTYTGQHQWFYAPSGTAGTAITFTQAMTLDASGNLLVGMTSAATSSAKTIHLANATVPTANPSGGGVLYVEGGALKYRGSSGTVTTIANA